MKPRSERDKRYEEKHRNERKAKNVVWGTSIPRETAEGIDAFLKKHGYTKVKLIEEGYKSLLEQAGEINTDLAKIIDGYDAVSYTHLFANTEGDNLYSFSALNIKR